MQNLKLFNLVRWSARGALIVLALYESAVSWQKAFLAMPQTALGGIIKGLFADEGLNLGLKTLNQSVRNIYRVEIENSINCFVALVKENRDYEVNGIGIPYNKLVDMFYSNDFSEFKTIVTTDNQRKVIENFEKLPLSLRLFCFRNISFLFEKKVKLPMSQIYREREIPEDKQQNEFNKFNKRLDEFFHKKPSMDSHDIFIKFVSDTFSFSNDLLPKPKEFEKAVFHFGKSIGKNLSISSERSKFRYAVELVLLTSLLIGIYGCKMLKSVIITPFEVFKIMLVGLVEGFAPGLLNNIALEALLISLKNPINEFRAAFNATYGDISSNSDYKEKYGKKAPMKALERLIAERFAYFFIDEEIKEMQKVISEDPEAIPDIKAGGMKLDSNNPAYFILAALESIPLFLQQITYTIGHSIGEGCGSFANYVGLPTKNERGWLIQ